LLNNKENQDAPVGNLLIVVVNWNTKDLLLRCLQSLQLCQTSVAFDVVIVDNGSDDGSIEMIKANFLKYFLICNTENMGFAKANNLAFHSFPHYANYLLLNSDAAITADVINTLQSFLKTHLDVAAVAPALKLPSGKLQFGGAGWGPSWINTFNSFFMFSSLSKVFKGLFICQKQYMNSKKPIFVDWLAGAALLIRKEAIEKVGVFDEFYFVYGEDAEWCWRARKSGWKMAYLPYVSALHELGASSTSKFNPSWFLNLADAISISGSRMNYILFLITGLMGYFLRSVLYTLLCFIQGNKNYGERKKQFTDLLATCYKLLISPTSVAGIRKGSV